MFGVCVTASLHQQRTPWRDVDLLVPAGTSTRLDWIQCGFKAVIHRVPDKFTTSLPQVYHKFTTSSRHVHDKKSQPVDQLQFCLRFTTDFYSRLVRDKIKHVWSCRELVANESWSRFCQLQAIWPIYVQNAVMWFLRRPTSSPDSTSQNLLMTSKQSRHCWRRIFSVDHLQRHVITSRLVRNTFRLRTSNWPIRLKLYTKVVLVKMNAWSHYTVWMVPVSSKQSFW
jgi:hypothetical protein